MGERRGEGKCENESISDGDMEGKGMWVPRVWGTGWDIGGAGPKPALLILVITSGRVIVVLSSCEE